MHKSLHELDVELHELLAKGFFDDAELARYADKDGKIDVDHLFIIWEGMGGRKYTMKYYLKYRNLGNCWVRYDNRDRDEEIFKELIEKGITWKEKFGELSPDIVL